jgi:glycosyltransferase involved in cell wall biosynthesis
LHTIAGLTAASGGPSRSVSALCEHLARQGMRVELLSLDAGPSFGKPLTPPEDLVRTTLVPCRFSLRLRLVWSHAYRRTLETICRDRQVGLIHDHGMWLPTNHSSAAVARKLKLPFIVSPRGMATEWALQHKSFKKRLAWLLYQRRDLRSATVLHATSQQEAQDLRALGLRQPIAVIPNGIATPPWQEPNNGREPRTVLFLSRISPVKGLLNLVQAWAAVRPKNWRMVIAGPDEEGHRAAVEAALRDCEVAADVSFVGQVANDKWALYRSADVFILPTLSENFGIVVGEALACGVPVITTKAAPWEELLQHNCGWWVETGVEPLAEALREALAATDAQRREMGLRGRKLIEAHYTWCELARKMESVYRWLTAGGPRPECMVE